jgi:transcriptional regulator GlxA family with amidase domain
MKRRVAIVVFEGGQTLDAVGPYEVLAGACEAQTRRGGRDLGYAPELVGERPGPLAQESGIRLLADRALEDLPRTLDTLIIAGGAGARRAARDPAIARKVARAAGRARRVASVCTGAFVLAAAGLLDGRRATTHWAYCEELARAHPTITVERSPIFVRDGQVWTSAGVTAGIDLTLALVEDDLGRELALLVARWLVMFVRRAGGQSQFSAQLSVQAAEREPVRELQAFIVEHPAEALDVPELARRAGMSVRNFARVFRAEVGVSPAVYVEQVRLETARRLLESTGLSIDRVAEGAGFGTPESLRRSFARIVGVSPREYRARFGALSSKPVPKTQGA